jgi:hypothetical protein
MISNGDWGPLTLDEIEDVIEEIIEFEGGYRKIERWRKNGEISGEEYFNLNGELHRESGPASIGYSGQTGTLTHIHYYKNGQPHRIGGPAMQDWWSNGVLEHEAWYVEGKQHRDNNKPALIWMDTSGDFSTLEQYFSQGRLHRTDGPAEIERTTYRDKHKQIDTILETEKFYYHGLQQIAPVDDPNLTPS